MLNFKTIAGASIICACLISTAYGQNDKFHPGPLIPNFGKIAEIEGREPIPAGVNFKVSFDISKQAEAGALNRSLESGARFLNMHARSGVGPENMALAFVIHGSAVRDVTNNARYEADTGQANANADLIAALVASGVEIYVCGQSAVYYGVETSDLLPGVKMSLSAMTAHSLLQQSGYTLNPF